MLPKKLMWSSDPWIYWSFEGCIIQTAHWWDIWNTPRFRWCNTLQQVACSCLYIAQCCPSFYPKKRFEWWRWIFHKLRSTSRTRLIFVHILSSFLMDLFVFICFTFHFYLFFWSQYIQNYDQLVVVHYHNYYSLKHHREF